MPAARSVHARRRAALPRPPLLGRTWALLCLLLALELPAVRADAPSARQALSPPIALGGECRLLASCPWSGPLAASFRLGGFVWLGQDGDPRPVSVVPFAALSASLWRWAEAGAMFTGRGGAARDDGPALLQLPITLWARVSPQLGTDGGLQTAAEIRYAVGRAPFDASGTVYTDQESYALSVGYRTGRIEAFVTAAYQEAASRSYRGLEASGGLYALVLRSLGLQLGAEAVGRLGGAGEGRDAAPSWTAAAVIRFGDEHGVSGTLGAGAGGGPGMPGRMPAAFVFGMSFGPGYRPHPREPGHESMRELLEAWIGDGLRRLSAPRLQAPPVLPPLGLPATPLVPPPLGLPVRPWTGRDPLSHKLPLGAPSGLCRIDGLSTRGAALALRSCYDQRLAGPIAAVPPPAPGVAPPAPQTPHGPPGPFPPALAGGPPRTGGGVTPRGPERGPLRTGRGAGWTDPDTRAPSPRDLTPTFWAGGRPPGSTISPAAAPPPPPAIPLDRPLPQALPPGIRPDSVPPFLRPTSSPPLLTVPPPAPAAEAPPQRTGSARDRAIDAALPAAPEPARQPRRPLPAKVVQDVVEEARGADGQVRCTSCGVVTTEPPAGGYTLGYKVLPTERQIDHIIPLASGGTSAPSNLNVKCAECNRAKGARPWEPWLMNPVMPTPMLRAPPVVSPPALKGRR